MLLKKHQWMVFSDLLPSSLSRLSTAYHIPTIPNCPPPWDPKKVSSVCSASMRLGEARFSVFDPAIMINRLHSCLNEGPMVYGVFYLPKSLHKSLLADTHKFDDSKVLTPAVRSQLMEKLCTSDSDLYANCGWATDVMSARVISAGMLKSTGMYNLNAQAMDSTIELIKGVLARGVNVTEIYVDTIGSPAIYQKKLERIFPTAMVTVAKKADSLYPCVSAASVCAKVTRDAALEVCYEDYAAGGMTSSEGWGSGYPSDGRTSTWLKSNMDPVFGWGTECRFSWGTVKELFDAKNRGFKVDWPAHDDDNSGMKMTDFFTLPADSADDGGEHNELTNWFGKPVSEELF